MKFFLPPIIVSVVVLLTLGFFSGLQALFIATLLVLLEITLSFDNAVVNARVLISMSEKWQRRFMTWGILIAVFGTRVFLPIVIVSLSVWASPWFIIKLAVFSPAEYGHLLEQSSYAINSFGATFLLLVALKYFFDDSKTVHWIGLIERRLTRFSDIDAAEIGIALLAILGFSFFVPGKIQSTVLVAGIAGVIVFILMEGVIGFFSSKQKRMAAAGVASQGLALFLYLEVLDAAFSLDSVVGAFALTTSIPVIIIGLGIGAYFVRSLTIFFVRRRTLESLMYLEHGAHWAILGLSLSMFASLILEVPEIVTGSIGAFFVIAAYYSSVKIRGSI